MKHLALALTAALLAATSAHAASIRYDFTGTLTPDFVTPGDGDTIAAEAGLGGGSGGFSGFAIFDMMDPDLNPDPDIETYLPSSFGLTIGGYNFPTGGDSVFADVDPVLPGFTLNFQSAGDFSSLDAEFLSLSIGFPAGVSGIVQNPVAGDATVDFSINAGDGLVFGTGELASITVTDAVIPEPGAWALMIAGFGIAGGALRRRSVRVAYSVS